MKSYLYILIIPLILLYGCNNLQNHPDLSLEEIVSVEIVNKSFLGKNFMKKLVIENDSVINVLKNAINNSEKSLEDMNSSGGTRGLIEINFITKEGQKIVFSNVYTVTKGVFVIYYENWDTDAYKNDFFVNEIEFLLREEGS